MKTATYTVRTYYVTRTLRTRHQTSTEHYNTLAEARLRAECYMNYSDCDAAFFADVFDRLGRDETHPDFDKE